MSNGNSSAGLICFSILVAVGCMTCGGSGQDVCEGVDCSLHGECRAVDGQPVCFCDPGFVALGLVCHPDWCAELNCEHGTCYQNAEFAVCECEAGWQGESCDECAEHYHPENGMCVPDEPCDDDPCIHGVCRVEDGQEVCDCDAGYAGEHCDSCAEGYHPDGLVCVPDEADACHPNPCNQPHRTKCTIEGDSYTCSCDDGYHDEEGECVPDVSDPCDPNPCQEPHRTVCTPDGDSYTCSCDEGYHEEEGQCVPDTADPCDPNPCGERHRTVCSPDGDSYTCSCDPGYHDQDEACVPDCEADADLCAAAQSSFDILVSANGHSAIGYKVTERKADAFLEHVYRNWDENAWTRDLLFDSFLGVRTTQTNVWLDQIPTLREEYLAETGIIHVVQRVDDLRVDSYFYCPWELERPALVIVGKLTNEGDSGIQASLYTLHNYHLGDTTQEEPINPDFNDERIQFQTEAGAYLESGPGGALLHRPIGTADHHGCTPDNPWHALNNGIDLADTSDSGSGDDRVAGFQKDFSLAPGESGWFGAVSAFERFGDTETLAADVEQAYGSMTADQVLEAALAEWEDWRNPPPEGLKPFELMVWRQSEAILRQGQIKETSDLSYGQIVASLPPGNWNICWMRDMAYAIVALVRSGHLAEARDALEFVLNADTGYYQAEYVGVPYQVTITRYFGRGKEESDSNVDGPNIEFDGFGLFLWALGEYLKAVDGDDLLETYWETIRDEIAGALVSLVDDETGLISADSSIWEVHWNGRQKRYSYTSLAAARGLCEAASMASSQEEDVLAGQYETTAVAIRDALGEHAIDPQGVLASSYEELRDDSGYHDMASVEAFDWLLFNPQGSVAAATLDMFESELRVASGLGYFRNDDGGWYDSQEWVFVDLRASIGNRLAGRAQTADRLLDWITAQAAANHGMIAELHEPDSSVYEGEIPMVGFGAGAWILAISEREDPRTMEPACGDWVTK